MSPLMPAPRHRCRAQCRPAARSRPGFHPSRSVVIALEIGLSTPMNGARKLNRLLTCPGVTASRLGRQGRAIFLGDKHPVEPEYPAEPQGPSAPASPPAAHRRMGSANDLLPLGDWLRHDSLRSWPVLLFLALICIPSCALVVLGTSVSADTFTEVAWIFAAYFALAWLLLLGVIVRPAHVTRIMLVLIIVTALLTEIPLAVAMETALHDSNANLASSILTIGLPEELAKALPIVIVALI